LTRERRFARPCPSQLRSSSRKRVAQAAAVSRHTVARSAL
jgi:hypothetical protein